MIHDDSSMDEFFQHMDRVEKLKSLISLESLVDYILVNDTLVDEIIKHREKEIFVESHNDTPVVVLELSDDVRQNPIKVSILTGFTKRRIDLLNWWHTTQLGKPKIPFRRYPFYIDEQLRVYLKPFMKHRRTMYVNRKVFFVEDINFERYSRSCIKYGLEKLVDDIAKERWPLLYDKEEPEEYFVRPSDEEIERLRRKPECDDDYC